MTFELIKKSMTGKCSKIRDTEISLNKSGISFGNEIGIDLCRFGYINFYYDANEFLLKLEATDDTSGWKIHSQSNGSGKGITPKKFCVTIRKGVFRADKISRGVWIVNLRR